MNPNWHWNTWHGEKYSVCTLVCFALWPAAFETQGRRKSEMHRMTPDWTWTLNSRSSSFTDTCVHTFEAQILVHFALESAFFKTQGHRKLEMHWVTPNWTWTLNSQKYSIYTKYLAQRPKLWPVSLYDYPFSEIPGHQKRDVHRMTPNWTWTLDSQKYPVYTKDLTPRPKFWSVSF